MSLRDDIEKVQEKVEQTSFAYEMLKDYKKQNKRQFVIILVILGMWFLTIGYLVYTLNDIGTIEETTTTQEVSDVDNIENTNIINGDMYGESKTNKN